MTAISLVIPPSNYDAEFGYDAVKRTPLEGITVLRNALLKTGHTVEILDMRSCEQPMEWLMRSIDKASHLVGFTTFFDSYFFVEKAVGKLRNLMGNAVFIVGGALASGAPETFLRCAGVDVVVRGEGEKALTRLADQWPFDTKTLSIDGLSFLDSCGAMRNTGQAELYDDLDDAGPADWSYVSTENNGFQFLYATSRGCEGRCAYCCRILGYKRFKSPSAVEADLRYLKEVWGMKSLVLNDSDFLHDNPHLASYLEIFSKLDIQWGCFATPKGLTSPFLEHLSAFGCRNLRVGVEAFDEQTLHSNRRPVGLDEMLANLDILEKSRIPMITSYLLLGLPGQTEASMENTVVQMRKRKRLTPRPFILIPLPGSPVYARMRSQEPMKESRYLRSLCGISMDSARDLACGLCGVEPPFIQHVYDELSALKKERLRRYSRQIRL